MFKKTINDLKDLTETKHDVDVTVNVTTDVFTAEIGKRLVKTAAILAGIHVVAHAAIAVIDSVGSDSKKSDN